MPVLIFMVWPGLPRSFPRLTSGGGSIVIACFVLARLEIGNMICEHLTRSRSVFSLHFSRLYRDFLSCFTFHRLTAKRLARIQRGIIVSARVPRHHNNQYGTSPDKAGVDARIS